MIDRYTDDHFEQAVFSSKANFVNFVKINAEKTSPFDIQEMEWLAQRVAQNMFYFRTNINRAKTDYLILMAKLIEHGLLFKEFKDLPIDRAYPY